LLLFFFCFVFLLHKRFSHCYIKSRLKHCSQMDYFNNVISFWVLKAVMLTLVAVILLL